MKDKVLILGIAGFTGSHFSQYISKNNLTEKFEFIGIDYHTCESTNFETLEIDLSVPLNIQTLLIERKPNYIINLVGTFTTADFSKVLSINVGISQTIFSVCLHEKIPVKNILVLGSAAEYGACKNFPICEDEKLSPISLYGLSKVFQSETALFYFNNHNVNVTIARPFNLLGKGLSKALSIGSFVDQIKDAENDSSIFVGNVNSKRDFIDICDAIDAYWKLLLFGKPGEIYNVCAGSSHSIKEILDTLIKISGKKINIEVKDEFIKMGDIPDSFGDNSKLKKLFDWNVEDTLESSLIKMF